MVLVFLAEQNFVERNLPIDAKGFVGYANTAISLGMIEVVAFVLKNSHLAQYGKSMSKPLRNEELTMVVF